MKMKIDEIKEEIITLEHDKECIESAIDTYNDISWQYITEPHNVVGEMELILSEIVSRLAEINARLAAI
jgi:hypothetical protein|tara:strand:+ start:648 stop:854 length:207 start_codon:yes stop_codon:yes gene_type:complete